MSGLETAIRTALENADRDNPEVRARIYQSARQALEAGLRKQDITDATPSPTTATGWKPPFMPSKARSATGFTLASGRLKCRYLRSSTCRCRRLTEGMWPISTA